MTWNPNAGKKITLEERHQLVQQYRKNNPGKTHSNYFGREVLEEILANPEVAGITIIHGEASDGSMAPVLRGTTKDNQAVPGLSYNSSLPCPPICPDDPKEQ